MEIEEIKALWSEMSDQLEQQKKLTKEIILNMTQERYSRKFQRIFTYEAIASTLCFTVALALLFHFHKLDTWYYLFCGIYTLSIFILLPILILRSLIKLKRLNITDYNYKQTLVEFVKGKNQILQIQKVAAYFYLPLMLTTLVVAAKIINNKNFFTMEKSTSLYILMGITLLMATYVTYWGYNYYKKITNSAENVLDELE